MSEAFDIDDVLPQLVCRAERACFYIADTLRIPEPSFTENLAGGGWIQAFGDLVLIDMPLSEMMPVVVLQDKDGNFSGLLKTVDDIKYK